MCLAIASSRKLVGWRNWKDFAPSRGPVNPISSFPAPRVVAASTVFSEAEEVIMKLQVWVGGIHGYD